MKLRAAALVLYSGVLTAAPTPEQVRASMDSYTKCGMQAVLELAPSMTDTEAANAAVAACEPKFTVMARLLLEDFLAVSGHNPRLQASVYEIAQRRGVAMKEFLRQRLIEVAASTRRAKPPAAAPRKAATGKGILQLTKDAEGEARIILDGELGQGTVTELAQLLDAGNLNGASIFLNSPGGSLDAGLKIGRLLHKHSLWTHVGVVRNGSPSAGECYSSCVFALAGGYYRFQEKGSKIGVHRFYSAETSTSDLAIAQVISGEIVAFLREMGLDPNLFQAMSTTSGDDIRVLTSKELAAFQLINDGVFPADWKLITAKAGLMYLEGRQEKWSGIGRMSLTCDQGVPKMLAMYWGGRKAPPAEQFGGYLLLIDGAPQDVTLEEPLQSKDGYLKAFFAPDAAQLNSMKAAKEIGFAYRNADGFGAYDFNVELSSGREKFVNFLQFCGSTRWGPGKK